jgi:hypothetical protein
MRSEKKVYLMGIIYVEINLVSVVIVERLRFEGSTFITQAWFTSTSDFRV